MSEYWKTHWKEHVKRAGDDPCRQVARTIDRQPMDVSMFHAMSDHVVELLALGAHHRALDLCCGNGLLSVELASRCRMVIGVDFCTKLLLEMRRRAPHNLVGIAGDALETAFRRASFHRILCAAALQHFSEAEVVRLFKNFARWLKPDGLLLVTDIPETSRIWTFYDRQEREALYFKNVMDETPILGTWFDRVWLQKLARYADFREAHALDQAADYWFAHYRFDLLCRR